MKLHHTACGPTAHHHVAPSLTHGGDLVELQQVGVDEDAQVRRVIEGRHATDGF
jgi:hypothetical protein